MDDKNIKSIPINELRQEDGASDLASSPDMEPYLNYIAAVMQRTLETAARKTVRLASGIGAQVGICRLR